LHRIDYRSDYPDNSQQLIKEEKAMKLFRPAWDSKNEKRALKAVAKITDQAMLARVAKEARYTRPRILAIERVDDQILLADLATKDSHYHVRRTAVKRLTDPLLLAKIVYLDGESVIYPVSCSMCDGTGYITYPDCSGYTVERTEICYRCNGSGIQDHYDLRDTARERLAELNRMSNPNE
jgi:hypothetical protein